MARWFVSSDACGLFSANFTTVLILYAQFVFCKVIVLPWYGFSWHLVAYTCLSLLSLTSHTRAQFTNPGAVPKTHSSPHYPGPIPIESPIDHDTPGIDPTKPIARICRHCKCVKPYRAHHCSSCARCVIRMDHHCPWVNNCVAIFNQKYFLLFLLYTGLCCVYCAAMLIGRFISCTNNLRQCSVTGLQAVLCVINFVEALIFGLFVSVMMWDQMGAIFDNTPYIDSLKKVKGVRRGKYQSLKEVFGEPFSWRWFLPLATPAGLKDAFDFEVSRDELILPPKSKLPTATGGAANTTAAGAAAPPAPLASPSLTGSGGSKPLNAADAATDAALNGLHQRGAAANTGSAERAALLDGARA